MNELASVKLVTVCHSVHDHGFRASHRLYCEVLRQQASESLKNWQNGCFGSRGGLCRFTSRIAHPIELDEVFEIDCCGLSYLHWRVQGHNLQAFNAT